MTTTKLPRRGFRVLPRKPVEPVRPVTDCDTCDSGCTCDSEKDQGCGHWCCWGKVPEGGANTCHAVPAHRAFMEAYREYRIAEFAYQQTSHLR